ncbi:MAG: hypothetical protein KGD57_10210, partial [Candidatus Lokiarchaeota archaeon]|nr:hypothetical protein [Candidatus Lokiarchaeota archaeon]
PDGSAPIEVSITLNGVTYQMEKQDIYNDNYLGLIIYNVSIQLSAGLYNYYYNISDGKYNASYPIGELLLIVQEDPIRGGDNTLLIIIGITLPIVGIGVAVTIIVIKRKKPT